MESIDSDTLCYLGGSRGIQGADLKNLLRHVNISPMGHSSGSDIQAKYFSTLDETLLKRVQNKYWPDFLLYGYDLRPFLEMTKLSTTEWIKRYMEMAQLLLTTIKTLMNHFLSLPSPHLGIAIYSKDPYSRTVPAHPAKQN